MALPWNLILVVVVFRLYCQKLSGKQLKFPMLSGDFSDALFNWKGIV